MRHTSDMPERKLAIAQHLGLEARIVLTSLRSGPPQVSRGNLAQDLMDLRDNLPLYLEDQFGQAPTSVTETKSASTSELDNETVSKQADKCPFSQPFLSVLVDPRASGPHTLVALQAIYRLLSQRTWNHLKVSLESVTEQVLACKFEQTDPGADEAVEMAIADVLLLLLEVELPGSVVMDAFNTVFMTRNTFVHSAALCYHFEQVLHGMIKRLCNVQNGLDTVMAFLTNQLLHTPLVSGDGLDESTREAADAHDATRTLCLQLVRTLVAGVDWSTAAENLDHGRRNVLSNIQDELCLSLLLTGQAIWAYNDSNTPTSPGFVSLEVLAEVCATISALWSTQDLRGKLIVQFETIFTGIYTRALIQLRKRKSPVDSLTFNANLIFDAEIEIIMESLIDILSLHEQHVSLQEGGGGALESIFVYYDCDLRRPDVALGLVVELSRCCGGQVDHDGNCVLTPSNSSGYLSAHGDQPTLEPELFGEEQSGQGTVGQSMDSFRHVPAHVKELCAQALTLSMRCLFQDDNASAETLRERSGRKKSILSRQVVVAADGDGSTHGLRNLKSRKKLMCKAAKVFNKKGSLGIQFLVDSGLIEEPVTPRAVATFLREGIVMGLDKKAVGVYLGESGKAPVAGKSPPSWERDWFHKDALRAYCSLFLFENQSLLDGLRMFLAAFRLPGEAQQIDRILQAFADSCGQVCEEQRSLGLFSRDPKRASDTAYLLSFSIIMLNTDQHNENIKEERKMTCDDFVKNNRDYGRDIMEKGKELPDEYLTSIYDSIREEEIRTEGEGAEGVMTVERWKDVLRGSAKSSDMTGFPHTQFDLEDLTEIVLEHVWKPIASAIAGLWGLSSQSVFSKGRHGNSTRDVAHTGMLGIQGARLGMDLAIEMMTGVRKVGRLDVFCKMFSCVCDFTGLLSNFNDDAVQRTWQFCESVESQSAVVVALQTALQSGGALDEQSWKLVWAMLMELRDLKLIAKSQSQVSFSIFHESDADLLSDTARRHWNMCLIKGDMDYRESRNGVAKPTGVGSVLSVFGRALFGSEDASFAEQSITTPEGGDKYEDKRSLHGKEDLVLWNEGATSDDETYDGGVISAAAEKKSLGALFETLIVRESMNMSSRINSLPVTGLERMERFHISPRAKVRERLKLSCSFESFVLESRFLENDALRNMVRSLTSLLASTGPSKSRQTGDDASSLVEGAPSETSSLSSSIYADITDGVPISPASEAFAEVLLCEIFLRNKDRAVQIWEDVLQDHYIGNLSSFLLKDSATKVPVDPGLEKRVSGLLRLSFLAIQKKELADLIIASWRYVLPMNTEQYRVSPLRALDRHIGEGLWRLVAQVDDLANLGSDGWEGLISLFQWCATRGAYGEQVLCEDTALPEDDIAIQSYRSIQLVLGTTELDSVIPYSLLDILGLLLEVGEKRRYSQLSIATLDLLSQFYERAMNSLPNRPQLDVFWQSCWGRVVKTLSIAIDKSSESVSDCFHFVASQC